MLDAAETTTDNTLGFAGLLQEALDRPGILSEAYRAFHHYSLGNQLLAAVQLCERGQPFPRLPRSAPGGNAAAGSRKAKRPSPSGCR